MKEPTKKEQQEGSPRHVGETAEKDDKVTQPEREEANE